MRLLTISMMGIRGTHHMQGADGLLVELHPSLKTADSPRELRILLTEIIQYPQRFTQEGCIPLPLFRDNRNEGRCL